MDRNTPKRDAVSFEFPVKAGATIFAGTLVGIDTADTYAKKGATATTLKIVGCATETADNTTGADGAVSVKVERGCFRFANSTGGDLITRADIGAQCFCVDAITVAKTNGTNTRSIAGTVRDVDGVGVWVEI